MQYINCLIYKVIHGTTSSTFTNIEFLEQKLTYS